MGTYIWYLGIMMTSAWYLIGIRSDTYVSCWHQHDTEYGVPAPNMILCRHQIWYLGIMLKSQLEQYIDLFKLKGALDARGETYRFFWEPCTLIHHASWVRFYPYPYLAQGGGGVIQLSHLDGMPYTSRSQYSIAQACGPYLHMINPLYTLIRWQPG